MKRHPIQNCARVATIISCVLTVTGGTLLFNAGCWNAPARNAFESTGVQESRLKAPRDFEPLHPADQATRERLRYGLSQRPISFEPNMGQHDCDARFVSTGARYRMLVSAVESTILLPGARSQPDAGADACDAIKMKLVGGNPLATMTGVDPLVTRVNYLIGDDPAKWHTDIPTFGRVSCHGVYPGVDIVYYGNQKEVEYDFVVARGADPGGINIRFEGTKSINLDSKGDLVLEAESGRIKHERPIAYQVVDGAQREVAVGFAMFEDNTVGFRLGDYDKTRELMIDPLLSYSTYLGGSGDDFGRAIFIDADGAAYIAGDSRSPDFTHGTPANSDIFVGKLLPNGQVFSYSFFGGSKDDFASGLAVDADGNTYVCGTTASDDFARVNSINHDLSGSTDAFVVKLNAKGDAYVYSTLIGGSGDENGVSVALDGDGNAYLAGKTTSSDFPTANAIQAAYGGGASDAFVSKIMPDGSALVYSTYLGGTDADNITGTSAIAVDSSGKVYVTGDTLSTDFPVMNALQSTKSGPASTSDAFLSKLNADGSDFLYSTYLGGASDDLGKGVRFDSLGSAYVGGTTSSLSFPGSASTRPSTANTDAFVAKLTPSGSSYAYLTFIGGSPGNESGNALAVDSLGLAYIAGSAGAGLVTLNSVQSYFRGGSDAFVAQLSPGGTVALSTYLGGSGDDVALAIGVDSGRAIQITGYTDSNNLLTNMPINEENAGGTDVLVAKIDPNFSSTDPVIYDVRLIDKELRVFGQNFDGGAVVRVNDVEKGTKGGDDPTQLLISKKGGKKIKPGHTAQIQVVNANGNRSNIAFVTRPDA